MKGISFQAVPHATKGSPGGKLPSGNFAKRSPARSFAAASRKQATKSWLWTPMPVAAMFARHFSRRRHRQPLEDLTR
jgi:hypothetical protein